MQVVSRGFLDEGEPVFAKEREGLLGRLGVFGDCPSLLPLTLDSDARQNFKRTVGVAAIYLYCLYLIVHNGNKYVMPHDQVVEYIGENRKA